ncbi:twin-arginine translocase TatA/TatE family subunit, partial [Actinomadura sp. NPDC049753]|uniref:twin-arginine translocase TatA/TatE family subunit n=1 Tax=Actinomadura sp. NPDC049753 TaxID=3154739 RepID=UPI003447E11E
EMAVLVVLALVIFGDKLPQVAGQAGRMLRQFRERGKPTLIGRSVHQARGAACTPRGASG